MSKRITIIESCFNIIEEFKKDDFYLTSITNRENIIKMFIFMINRYKLSEGINSFNYKFKVIYKLLSINDISLKKLKGIDNILIQHENRAKSHSRDSHQIF